MGMKKRNSEMDVHYWKGFDVAINLVMAKIDADENQKAICGICLKDAIEEEIERFRSRESL